MPVVIDTSGFADFANYYALLPQRTTQALAFAINDTMRWAIAREGPITKQILAEVNFSPSYLADRIDITQFATPTQLQGVIRGRDRPTSLARFAIQGQVSSTGNPIISGIEVHPGQARPTRRLFFLGLRAGKTPGVNAGLAIRLRPGERITSVDRFDPKEIFPNVFVLYGPSIDQVFRGVADDVAPVVMEHLEQEFTRQFNRLG